MSVTIEYKQRHLKGEPPMTQTTRRTAKITTAKRGYVAIEVRFAGETQRIACVAKVDMHITGTNGASVEIKPGEAYTLVRSESLSKELGKTMFYIVRQVSGEKKCSCPAMKPCRHETGLAAHIAEHGPSAMHLRAHQRAAETSKATAMAIDEPAIAGPVAEHIATEYQGLDDVILTDEDEAASRRIALVNKAAEEAALKRFAEQQRRRQAEAVRRDTAPLNGNRGFSLLKV